MMPKLSNMTSHLSLLVALVLTAWAWGEPSWAQAADTTDTPGARVGYYSIEVAVYSYVPGQELTTYQSHGSCKGAPNTTLTLGTREFGVKVTSKLKAQKLFITITITPEAKQASVQARETQYELTGLDARSEVIAQDPDGRIYKLDMTPTIIPFPKVKPFSARDLHLDSWGFSASPVVLNDQDYLGQLGMAGGNCASCDIPGVAKVEFSLRHLRDARPLGVLADGVLKITHEDGTTLQISNVTNGLYNQALKGGPYQVWVRWDKPSQTVEEYRRMLEKQLPILEERVKAGEVTVAPGMLERMAARIQSLEPRVGGILGSSIRQAMPNELEEPAE